MDRNQENLMDTEIPDFQEHINKAFQVLYSNKKYLKIKNLLICAKNIPMISFYPEMFNVLHFAIFYNKIVNENNNDELINLILSSKYGFTLINQKDKFNKYPIEYAIKYKLYNIVEKINTISKEITNCNKYNTDDNSSIYDNDILSDSFKNGLDNMSISTDRFLDGLKNNNFNKNESELDTLNLNNTESIFDTEINNNLKNKIVDIKSNNITNESNNITSEPDNIYIKGGSNSKNIAYEKYIESIVDNIKNNNLNEYANNINDQGILTGGRKRTINPETEKINNEINEKIKSEKSDLDEKYYPVVKYTFYKQVKEKYPELTSYERSKKVKDLITKKNINNINLEKMEKEREIAYQERLKLRSNIPIKKTIKTKKNKSPRPKKTLMKTHPSNTDIEDSNSETSSESSSESDDLKIVKKSKDVKKNKKDKK